MAKIGIIGAGAWGTTLAQLFSQKHDVVLWSHEIEVADCINQKQENSHFLPGIKLSPKIIATVAPADLKDCELVLFVTPSRFLRSTAHLFRMLREDATLVSATKGLESQTLKRISEIIAEEFPKNHKIAVLSGPNLSREIAQGLPAASVIASVDHKLAQKVQELLSIPQLRLYSSDDPIGVELGGALKNVIALAAGIADALKIGANAKAALLVRGIAEITRLAVAMGAKKDTLMGLTGIGDLIATCESPLSRNHQVGIRLAKGENIETIGNSMKEVAEGVFTCPAALALAKKMKVEMPITEKVDDVLAQRLSPKDALTALMSRSLKAE